VRLANRPIEHDGHALDFLIKLRCLDEAPMQDKRAVGCAIAALLADAARN